MNSNLNYLVILELCHQKLGCTSINLKVGKMSSIAFLFLLFFFTEKKMQETYVAFWKLPQSGCI